MIFRPKKLLYLLLNQVLIFMDVFGKVANSEFAEILHRPIRSLPFPSPSNMGLFFALAVPLEDPEKSISLSYFFEANYNLPTNFSYVQPTTVAPQRKRRSIDRTTIYQVLENKLESSGHPGRECLLRAICETSEYPLRHNGVIGDILHVIFTPSSSRQENLPEDIVDAEFLGRSGNCSSYVSPCPAGLFDLIGVLV